MEFPPTRFSGGLQSARHLAAILLPLCLLVLCGCQKELVCPGSSVKTVRVAFMWDEAPEPVPEGMTLCFFPLGETEKRWIFNIPSSEGGNVELPTGEYQVLAYNADTRVIDFTHTDSFADYTATTLDASGEQAARPDMLYGAAVARLRVTECGIEYLQPDQTVKSCGEYLMRMWPRRLTPRYNVFLKEAEHLSAVRSVRASLVGIACGCVLSTGDRLGPAVGIDFGMTVLSDDKAEGTFLNFGAFPGSCQTLELTFLLADGTEVRYSTDVTDQIKNSSPTEDVDIIVKGIVIPATGDEPVGGDSGLDVDVDGWDVIIIDINTDARRQGKHTLSLKKNSYEELS